MKATEMLIKTLKGGKAKRLYNDELTSGAIMLTGNGTAIRHLVEWRVIGREP